VTSRLFVTKLTAADNFHDLLHWRQLLLVGRSAILLVLLVTRLHSGRCHVVSWP
jgi:hypothetical protein